MRYIKLLISNLGNFAALPLYWLTSVFPKNKNTWVFGSWFGTRYSDNTRYMYEYCQKNTNINVIWVCKDKELIKRLKQKGVNAFYYKSVSAIFYQMSAQAVFVTQAVRVDLFGPAIGGRTKIFQLWHGLPIKKIMSDTASSPPQLTTGQKLLRSIFPFNLHRHDYVISSSEETTKVFASAFQLPLEQVLCSGLPRVDVFDKTKPQRTESTTSFKAIYMPTFRGEQEDDVDLFSRFKFDVADIDKQLCENDIELTIRMHPVNKPPENLVSQITSSQNLRFSDTDDVYDEINGYDALITDFSSIYLDYIVTDRPIIFAPFDYDTYIAEDRNLYYQYEDVTLPPYCYDWVQIIDALKLASKGELGQPVEKYQQVKSFFHEDSSANSSRCEHLFTQVIKELE